MKKILAIGAHYDDIELGCSGTLYKHIQNGDEVIIAITSSDEHRTGSKIIRRKEQLQSMKSLGINNDVKSFYEGINDDDINDVIGELDIYKPDIIFVPFEKDTHQAHVRSSIIGKAVGRKRNITTYFYDSGSTYDFYPNIFSFINFEQKYIILQCFQSQIKCSAINIDIVKKKNSYLASLITKEENKYAEGFMVRKMIYIIQGNKTWQ